MRHVVNSKEINKKKGVDTPLGLSNGIKNKKPC
jgi:hypothetical protein